MNNTNCPYELVPLGENIVRAFSHATALPGQNRDHQTGFFSCLLADILKQFNDTLGEKPA